MRKSEQVMCEIRIRSERAKCEIESANRPTV